MNIYDVVILLVNNMQCNLGIFINSNFNYDEKRIYDSYVLKTFFSVFLYALLILSMIAVYFELSYILNIQNINLNTMQIAKMILLEMPLVMHLISPIACYISTIVLLYKLNSEDIIMTILITGIDPKFVFRTIVKSAAIICVLMYTITATVMHKTHGMYENIFLDAIDSVGFNPTLGPSHIRISEDTDLYFEEYDSNTNQYIKLLIFNNNDLLFAHKGDLKLLTENNNQRKFVKIHLYDGYIIKDNKLRIIFDRYDADICLSTLIFDRHSYNADSLGELIFLHYHRNDKLALFFLNRRMIWPLFNLTIPIISYMIVVNYCQYNKASMFRRIAFSFLMIFILIHTQFLAFSLAKYMDAKHASIIIYPYQALVIIVIWIVKYIMGGNTNRMAVNQ